jgi:hypothetical protein
MMEANNATRFLINNLRIRRRNNWRDHYESHHDGLLRDPRCTIRFWQSNDRQCRLLDQSDDRVNGGRLLDVEELAEAKQ